MSLPTPREPARTRAQDRAASAERGSLRTNVAHLELGAASCRGQRHEMNEDCYSALDGATPVYVVADGVGGGAMAWRASRELVWRVHRALDGVAIDAAAVRHALLAADRAVARSLATHTDQLGAATVALCAGADERLSTWLVAWVGDCRAYRLDASTRSAKLLTHDDTYRHLAETPPAGSTLDDPARMVGNGAVTMPNIVEVALGDGEMLVLMSDGVHKHVDPRQFGRVLGCDDIPLARRCAQLVALARGRGSVDDATVLVVHRAAVTAPVEEFDDAA